jgi:hypothetical protein
MPSAPTADLEGFDMSLVVSVVDTALTPTADSPLQ